MTSVYIHGVSPDEQRRLARLNDLLNPPMLAALDLAGVRSVLDMGAGLGQFTRDIARALGPGASVVGVERDERQRAAARALAQSAGEGSLVEFRAGDALDPPLTPAEWGAFDLAHARFILEHVPEPQRVVSQLVRAVKPGGTIVLADDDHAFFALDPPLPALDCLWGAYIDAYRRLGLDPHIGRRLPRLLRDAGCSSVHSSVIPALAVAGEAAFDALVDNWLGLLTGARTTILEQRSINANDFNEGVNRLREVRTCAGASFWWSVCLAVGRR